MSAIIAEVLGAEVGRHGGYSVGVKSREIMVGGGKEKDDDVRV
jgi:hypothetical protein